jgi:serine/threonine protein kinase/CHAT domain-containing protein/Tfp pilus assembly protein PilF
MGSAQFPNNGASDGCPSAAVLDLLLADELSGPERDPVEAHVEGCAPCQERLERMIENTATAATMCAPPPGDPEPPEDFLRRLNELPLPAPALAVADPVTAAKIVVQFEGRRLGHYEILEKLGTGNMGVVYKARHTELDRVVALKVLPAGFTDEVSIARFKNEARAAGRLDHPNIVGAHDAGQLDGVHFLVMTFVDGVDLGRLVRVRQRLEVADACEVIRQAATGLHHAFGRGLVHRDIKPSNLMLARDGRVKVLDLGIARALDVPVPERLTATGMLLGTADYLAPEQWDDPHRVDTRADVYGLGCTLYHLLIGRPPFSGPAYDSILAKMRAHLETPPTPITGLRPKVPPALAAVVDRMLAKDPADRFATPGEVAETLRPFAAGADFATLLEQSGNAVTPVAAADTTESARTLPHARSRSKRGAAGWRRYVASVAVLAMSLLLVASFVLHFVPRNRGRDEPKPDNDGVAPPAQLLALSVSHRGKDDVARGEVGETVHAVPADDGVRVTVKLSAPAYCYLIAFNPDGTEQLCYPEDPDQPALYFPEHRGSRAMLTPPPQSAELRYPRDRVFTPDVAGLQAFVLVVSAEPLPPYAHWRARVSRIPWEPVLEEAQACWHFDGRNIERLPRERGRTTGGAPPPFRALCDFFGHRPELGTVHAISFPVTRPDKTADVPPEQKQLAGDDQKKEQQFNKKMNDHVAAGQYADAAQDAREFRALYEKNLVPTHPYVITIRATVKMLEQIAALPKKAQDDQSEANKLQKQIDELADKGLHHEAIALAEKVEALRRRDLGDDSEMVAVALNTQGILYNWDSQYKQAEQSFTKAIAIAEKVWGPDHPRTIAAVGNLALALSGQRRFTEALILNRRALKSRLRYHGEVHADTALTYNNIATNLEGLGDWGEAETMHRKALAIFLQVHQGDHRQTAISLNNLGYNLNNQGRYTEAESWYKKALDMKLALFGPSHFQTAEVYNNLATNIADQTRYAAAEPLFRKALAVFVKTPGEDSNLTLSTYNNLALCLSHQGRLKDGEEIFRRVLGLSKSKPGEETRSDAIRLNNLAFNLQTQKRFPESRELLDKSLAINQRILGEEHEETAASYNSIAGNLNAQGEWAEAEPLIRKALVVIRRRLGEEHPFTITVIRNLGADLYNQGKLAEAEELSAQALARDRKVLGEGHSNTAGSYKNLIRVLWARGKYREAERLAADAAASFETARRRVSFSGLERVRYAAENSPLPLLAATAARNGKPELAWRWLESDLARGLLDELAERPLSEEERRREQELLGQLKRLDDQIGLALGANRASEGARQLADGLRRERDALQAEFAQLQAELAARHGVAAGKVYDLERIQSQLAADAALVAWVDQSGATGAEDPRGEHWACVVRRQDPPQWVKLPGSGTDGAWTAEDDKLADEARRVFAARPKKDDGHWKAIAENLAKQRLMPLDRALGARDGMPAVGRLIVLPSPTLRGIPIEVLAERYIVSYAPSGTMFASLREKGARADARPPSIFAVGDPAFQQAPPPAKSPQRAASDGAETFPRLPGTRQEVAAIARLFPTSGRNVLLDAEASERRLNALAASGQLSRFRYLHFATHGDLDEESALNSALILSPDPPPLEWFLGTHEFGTGRVTALQIARGWKLNADLVTLSACRSALGRYSGGEGFLGFSQPLFRAGARSLVLSLWQVDDRATALLMQRLYENLLGSRPGEKPLAKAQALAAARIWLRGLSAAEVEKLVAGLPPAERGTARDPRRAEIDSSAVQPFAHPYYWSGFILIGDPD